MKRKIILDCDTGTDDAVAIILAAKADELDLLGVSSVNGNRGIDFTTENSLRVVELLEQEIPIHRGCGLPLTATLIKGRKDNIPFTGDDEDSAGVHGDYLELPQATRKEEELNGVSWIVETLMNSKDKVTLVPVGPLTNIATALRIEPRIKDKIEEIVIMGGGHHESNVVPNVEFNFYVDPDAAKIVLDSGCKITLVPLDATHSAAISSRVIKELLAHDSKVAQFTGKLIKQRLVGYNQWQPMEDQTTVPVHDALAVAYLINPDVLGHVVECYVDVDVSGGICDGQSVCDVERKLKHKEPNCQLALTGNSEIFGQILVDKITKS